MQGKIIHLSSVSCYGSAVASIDSNGKLVIDKLGTGYSNRIEIHLEDVIPISAGNVLSMTLTRVSGNYANVNLQTAIANSGSGWLELKASWVVNTASPKDPLVYTFSADKQFDTIIFNSKSGGINSVTLELRIKINGKVVVK